MPNMQIVKKIEDTQDHCAMLTHVPHGNEDGVLLRSITGFLLGTLRYQYHGAGFDYECASPFDVKSPPHTTPETSI